MLQLREYFEVFLRFYTEGIGVLLVIIAPVPM